MLKLIHLGVPYSGGTQLSNVFSSALYIKLYTVFVELILTSSKGLFWEFAGTTNDTLELGPRGSTTKLAMFQMGSAEGDSQALEGELRILNRTFEDIFGDSQRGAPYCSLEMAIYIHRSQGSLA